MPSVVRDQCDNLVETYGPAIVEILSRDIDAKDVCTLMQLCDSQAEGKLVESIQNLNFRITIKAKSEFYYCFHMYLLPRRCRADKNRA